MLSYHRLTEAIPAKIQEFHWCSSGHDILSKHWHKVKDTVVNYLTIKETLSSKNQIDGLVHQEGE